MQEDIIKKYFESANAIVISEMYLNAFKNSSEITMSNLKSYNPGHLGTSMSMNFILANLYYFLNEQKLSSKIVIGPGHAGVSLAANLWLNGTLELDDSRYQRNKRGLNNLINDFGNTIRSEINPEYPTTIYDGGELGYSLGVAYGYAINSTADIIPCIIGDGEAETGTLSSSWQLSKLLKINAKVLPIINLNGLKMGSNSYLSKLSDEELTNYFTSLGYDIQIIDSHSTDITNSINAMQTALKNTLNCQNPLIIFKSLKGYTLPEFEGTLDIHKNPLQELSKVEKLKTIKKMISIYDTNIFDNDDNLLKKFDKFKIIDAKNERKTLIYPLLEKEDISLDEFLYNLLNINNGLVFSPDEIYSNKFNNCSDIAIEIVNENLLQALYQGYTMAGNIGYYIAYEGFMPIISSMITQYYKYLKQKKIVSNASSQNSLNYILTSTCWENTYSHQNPDFVNSLFEKKDEFYNIVYPKDIKSAIKYIQEFTNTKDKINILTISKRHQLEYSNFNDQNNDIEIIKDCQNPDLVLLATGDYMLDIIMSTYDILTKNNIKTKVVYISKPQILNIENKDSLNETEFKKYFNEYTPSVYLYCGYASTIKALLFDRNTNCQVLGYNDEISFFGRFDNNAVSNKISVYDIIKICQNKLSKTKKLKK